MEKKGRGRGRQAVEDSFRLPANEGSDSLMAPPGPPQTFLPSLTLLPVRSLWYLTGFVSYRVISPRQDWWPARPGWQAAAHLYLLLESNKENWYFLWNIIRASFYEFTWGSAIFSKLSFLFSWDGHSPRLVPSNLMYRSLTLSLSLQSFSWSDYRSSRSVYFL